MFLVCDKIMHLRTLLFSWLYDQENNTLPIDFPGRMTRKMIPSLSICRGYRFPGTAAIMCTHTLFYHLMSFTNDHFGILMKRSSSLPHPTQNYLGTAWRVFIYFNVLVELCFSTTNEISKWPHVYQMEAPSVSA